MNATIKVRCTTKKEVFYPGQSCWVYEFYVLGGGDGGDPQFPSGQAVITVMGTETQFNLGTIYSMSFTGE